jgi:hypothetical protein
MQRKFFFAGRAEDFCREFFKVAVRSANKERQNPKKGKKMRGVRDFCPVFAFVRDTNHSRPGTVTLRWRKRNTNRSCYAHPKSAFGFRIAQITTTRSNLQDIFQNG